MKIFAFVQGKRIEVKLQRFVETCLRHSRCLETPARLEHRIKLLLNVWNDRSVGIVIIGFDNTNLGAIFHTAGRTQTQDDDY